MAVTIREVSQPVSKQCAVRPEPSFLRPVDLLAPGDLALDIADDDVRFFYLAIFLIFLLFFLICHLFHTDVVPFLRFFLLEELDHRSMISSSLILNFYLPLRLKEKNKEYRRFPGRSTTKASGR